MGTTILCQAWQKTRSRVHGRAFSFDAVAKLRRLSTSLSIERLREAAYTKITADEVRPFLPPAGASCRGYACWQIKAQTCADAGVDSCLG